MKLESIASGSKGNCIIIEDKDTSIMVDAGISKKRIEEGLDFYNKTPEDIDGIFITHEHSDHVKGLGVFLRKYQVPVFGTEKTLKNILDNNVIGKVDRTLFNPIKKEKIFSIKNLDIIPMGISHDAVDPVCYRFNGSKESCGIVTDLGIYDEELTKKLMDLNSILIESNHDINMLQTGPYPYVLKQRIWSEKGHLSNEACGRLLNEIISDKLKNIVLGHLSGENNYPDLAFEAVRNEINMSQNNYSADEINIKVASREHPTCGIEF